MNIYDLNLQKVYLELKIINVKNKLKVQMYFFKNLLN